MQEVNEQILEKIKKLLALSTSPNPNEANAAIAKANELMLRHNISIGDIQTREMKDYTEEGIAYDYMIETKYVRRIITGFFFVKAILIPRAKTWNILGTKENVAIATYMFHHIKHKFVAAWQDYKKAHDLPGLQGKTDFFVGLYHGLQDKLTAERDRLKKEEGLIWLGDPKLNDFFKQQYPETKNALSKARVSGDAHAQNAGYQAGRKMQLNQGLGAGATKAARLTN